MTSQNSSPLVYHVLSHVTLDRLSKAVTGLANNTYTITLITNTDSDISGLVKNGDGVEYGVSLLPDRTFCSCRDSMFRHTLCKHVALLAVHALRTPMDARAVPVPPPSGWIGTHWNLTVTPQAQPQQPVAHLMRLNAGAVVCGEQYPEKILYWPWRESIVNNPQQWPEVPLCPDCIKNRYSIAPRKERAADFRF